MVLDIEQLEILKAVEDEGSISAAADSLFIAKSGLSRSIKNLENKVGFDLIEKNTYKAQLTSKAKMLVEKAEEICILQDKLGEFVKLLGENIESHIKISSSIMFPINKLSELIKITNKKFPKTHMFLEREVLSGEQLLLENKSDIAFVETKTNGKELEYKKVFRTEMPLLIASEHPFLNTKKKSLEKLKQYPQIVLKSSLAHGATAGLYSKNSKWFVSDLQSKKELILNGMGWGRLPHFEIKKELHTCKLYELNEIEPTEKLLIYLARKKDTAHGKVNQFIWDCY